MFGLMTCGELRESIYNHELEGSLISYYWVWLVIFSWVVGVSKDYS